MFIVIMLADVILVKCPQHQTSHCVTGNVWNECLQSFFPNFLKLSNISESRGARSTSREHMNAYDALHWFVFGCLLNILLSLSLSVDSDMDGFRSTVTSQWHFEKGNYTKTRCRVCLIFAMCVDGIKAWRKRPLLACSMNAGVWYKLLQIIENLSSYTSRLICVLLAMRAVERSNPRPLASRLFYRLCLRGLCYCHKDASGASRDYGIGYQASTRPSANVHTVVQPPSQNQGYRTNRE